MSITQMDYSSLNVAGKALYHWLAALQSCVLINLPYLEWKPELPVLWFFIQRVGDPAVNVAGGNCDCLERAPNLFPRIMSWNSRHDFSTAQRW